MKNIVYSAVPLVLLAPVGLTTTVVVQAAHASIIGNLGMGYQTGKTQTYDDWYQGNGEEENSSCPRSGGSDSLSTYKHSHNV
jgi:hypothetical protein